MRKWGGVVIIRVCACALNMTSRDLEVSVCLKYPLGLLYI